MAKITPALPVGPTPASVFGEDWIQSDLANLTVDYKANLASNVQLGSCVYFNSLNKKWSILNGMNPPKNAMLGIVIHVDSEGKGQVKIHGIFESPLLEEITTKSSRFVLCSCPEIDGILAKDSPILAKIRSEAIAKGRERSTHS